MRPRLAPLVLLACVVGFVALELPAMYAYPGGTWWDATTRGYRFWQNFLCDLEWRVALDGQPNAVGSRLAELALISLSLGFLPFWWLVPRLFAGRPRLGRVVRVLGFVSVGGLIAVAFMPSERFGVLHGVMVVVGSVPGLSAVALAVAGLSIAEPRPRIAASLGAGMFAFGLVDFGLYFAHLVAHVEGRPIVPALQKVALMLLLAWMVAVAVRAPAAGAPHRVGARDATETRPAP